MNHCFRSGSGIYSFYRNCVASALAHDVISVCVICEVLYIILWKNVVLGSGHHSSVAGNAWTKIPSFSPPISRSHKQLVWSFEQTNELKDTSLSVNNTVRTRQEAPHPFLQNMSQLYNVLNQNDLFIWKIWNTWNKSKNSEDVIKISS